jgi:phosphate transport system permease protein
MREAKGFIIKSSMYLAALLSCGILTFLIGTIFLRGAAYVTPEFLSTQTSYLEGTIGILPNILNTLYIIAVAMLFALPLGVGAAVYLTEYAQNNRVSKIISSATETLTGIPSILFGLVGMLFFVQLMGLKQGVLAGGLTLVMMVLPTIITNTRESLLAVPSSFREGALALGSGKWHMIRTVVLPNALDGILTGCILAVGRITGESAALLFTAGFGLRLLSFKNALQSSSATLTVALYVYAGEQGKFNEAFAIAVVLLILTLILNISTGYFKKRLQSGVSGGSDGKKSIWERFWKQ